MRIIKYIFVIVGFLLGIYFICTFKKLNTQEGFLQRYVGLLELAKLLHSPLSKFKLELLEF